MSDEILPWDKPPVPVGAEPQPRLPAVKGPNLPRSGKPLNGHHHPAVNTDIVLARETPLITAARFVERKHTNLGQPSLLHQQGVFSQWTGQHYRSLLTEEMRAQIYNFLNTAKTEKGKPFNPSTRSVNEAIDALRAYRQMDSLTRSPAWLGEDPSGMPPANEMLACRNGLVHLPTGDLLPHTPAFYTTSSLGYDYNPKAPPPQHWQAFLKSIWEDDAAAIDAVQDMFGYMLGCDTSLQKIFLVVGPMRSGKGTISHTLTQMVGQDAVVSPTLGSLDGPFGLEPLIGKSIALIADARLSGRADQPSIAERLLSISGEDMQTVGRKYLGAWSGQLGARFLIFSNELPRISDASGALASRFVILTMTKSFYGHEDLGLRGRLLAELPGILNWAMVGWRRVRDRGYFIQPESSEEAIQELRDLSSPIRAFLREKCNIAAGLKIKPDDLYDAWAAWCKEMARDHPGTKQTFGRDLRSAMPALKTSQPRVDNPDRDRFYEGIALKDRKIWSKEEPNRFDLD